MTSQEPFPSRHPPPPHRHSAGDPRRNRRPIGQPTGQPVTCGPTRAWEPRSERSEAASGPGQPWPKSATRVAAGGGPAAPATARARPAPGPTPSVRSRGRGRRDHRDGRPRGARGRSRSLPRQCSAARFRGAERKRVRSGEFSVPGPPGAGLLPFPGAPSPVPLVARASLCGPQSPGQPLPPAARPSPPPRRARPPASCARCRASCWVPASTAREGSLTPYPQPGPRPAFPPAPSVGPCRGPCNDHFLRV